MPANPSKRQIHVWTNDEYREWLFAVAEADGFKVSDLIRKALREYATRNGHPAPPRIVRISRA